MYRPSCAAWKHTDAMPSSKSDDLFADAYFDKTTGLNLAVATNRNGAAANATSVDTTDAKIEEMQSDIKEIMALLEQFGDLDNFITRKVEEALRKVIDAQVQEFFRANLAPGTKDSRLQMLISSGAKATVDKKAAELRADYNKRIGHLSEIINTQKLVGIKNKKAIILLIEALQKRDQSDEHTNTAASRRVSQALSIMIEK
ncbi:hypothetical protein B0T22DRAFT_537165 [Podospora appendiculata]|uniref:Uncharacterized protein n=1 Tax=Podospora appendiculata TaxID=314037 RepID=A0AAE0XDZ2_9PEZI|nr:hypothetical protein B0T22DRAFT_537165 [Podospora appendiculata]